jgi:hypothetical protein
MTSDNSRVEGERPDVTLHPALWNSRHHYCEEPMEQHPPDPLRAGFVVKPPFVYDTQTGVAAIDVSLTGRTPTRASGLVGICLGGHPAAECLLTATGSGADHEIVVAIQESLSRHQLFARRFREIIKPETAMHVVAIPETLRTDGGVRQGP